MIRTITASTLALAALAGSASAAEITVSLAGKDARTVTREIKQAAEAVCRAADQETLFGRFDLYSCSRRTAAEARARISGEKLAQAKTLTIALR